MPSVELTVFVYDTDERSSRAPAPQRPQLITVARTEYEKSAEGRSERSQAVTQASGLRRQGRASRRERRRDGCEIQKVAARCVHCQGCPVAHIYSYQKPPDGRAWLKHSVVSIYS